MNLLSERVAHAIKVSGHTPSSVARAIGCTPAAVLQWISGSTKNIKNEYLFALADATGFEPRWIATGQGRERSLAALNHRVVKQKKNYELCDERGKNSLYMASEREAAYNTKDVA